MNALLRNTVRRLVRTGNLKITDAAGSIHEFGDGQGDPVHIVIRSRKAEWAITRNPWLALPEAYMDQQVDFLEGDVLGLLRIVYQGEQIPLGKVIDGVHYAFRRLQQINTAARARKNVSHHYDLSGDLYRLFLDADMQYSCAYFAEPEMTLEQAQEAKKRHIAAKLQLASGQKVLDIGSGWGGLGLYIAQHFDADVLGVTLSTEQHAVSNERAQKAGLSGRVRFDLRDYRALEGPFDRIVSVGMFEHVGVNHYRTFFEKCAALMKPDGVMLLHSIGRSGVPMATAAFIRKYIFPGGYIPALSEVFPAVEKAGLVVTDVEILRLHYAETLKNWRERFMANRERAKAIYDERFCRMWEFYLAGSEASFRWQDMMVFQMQIAKRNDTLPMTRDYMVEVERRLVSQDSARRGRRRNFPEAAE